MNDPFSARSNWFSKSREIDLSVSGYEMGDGVYNWFIDYKGVCVRKGWAFSQGDCTEDAKQAVKDVIFAICNARRNKASPMDRLIGRMKRVFKKNDKR